MSRLIARAARAARAAVAAVAAAAVVLGSAAGARAELPPGVYAVVCGRASRGDTRGAAMAACRRAGREDPSGEEGCGCRAHADLVTIAPGRQPVFFVDSCGLSGKTRAALAGACRDEQREHPSAPQRCDCNKTVRAVYGPFNRRPTRREFDDAAIYKFLGDDGEWKDEHGVDTCFPAGTPVATPAGERAIESIAEGDAVWSLDGDGALTLARVTRVKRRAPRPLLALRLANGRVLRVTGNHPIRARGVYRAAETIAVGDVLDSIDGEVSVESIEAERGEFAVYDLTVEPTHSFIAAGVAVHNY